jgi:hypothetical protein
LLNCFDGEPEHVFVIDRAPEPQPRPLTDVKKREWLSHFALGDLYSGERVGGPSSMPSRGSRGTTAGAAVGTHRRVG